MDRQELSTTLVHQEEHQRPTGVSSFAVLLRFLLAGGAMLLVLLILLYRLSLPPTDFSPSTLVEIPAGYSLKEIGILLREKKVIRSETLFALLVTYEEKEKSVAAGSYLFTDPSFVWEVARRVSSGDHDIATHRVTLPEGVTVREMGQIIKGEIPDFDAEEFVRNAQEKEGYLFPDTYFFFSTATSGAVILAMEENFTEKTRTLRSSSTALGSRFEDVLIMASIVEKEAATPKDRRIIAGILLKRLSIGMRLQVDAPFLYTLGKTSAELSVTDLASDSPYNTYRKSGLPPTPIGNPGADAIAAVIAPELTSYLYYLSDPDGVMHYAKTFEEHKKNKARYLP